MKLVLKYLKPFTVLVILAIILLFAQNLTNLALPNYMSEIVNTGLIRGGIGDKVPKVISEDAFELISAFLTEDDQKTFESGYTLSAPGSDESKKKANVYKELENRPAYILNKNDEALSTEIAAIYGKAAMALSSFSKMNGSIQNSQNTGLAALDISALYMMAENSDAAAISAAMKEAETSAALLNTEIGITFTKLFYAELGANLRSMQTNTILLIGLRMFIIILLGVVATVAIGFLSARISSGIGRAMRHDVFKKVLTFTPNEFDKFSTASLITRSTNDVQQVQMFAMMGIRMMCSAPIVGIGGIVMAVRKSNSMSWIIVVAVILCMGLQIATFLTVVPRFKIMQKLLDKLNRVSRESLTGMMVIRAFGNEEKEAGRFEEANCDIRNVHRFIERVMSLMNPAQNFLMGCVTLLIIWLGGNLIGISKLQIGDMMAFMQYTTQIISAFVMISMMFIMVPRALVSAGRIREVLDTEPEIKDKPVLKTLGGKSKGRIEFKNVSFKYNNAEDCVLSDISFTALPGQTTAFIGSTGSGKSTLINLIPRFYDVTEGSIEIDGVDIRDISQEELRSNLGYVPQKGVLFSGDIGSNMRYGREDADEDDIREAIRVAQGEDFVYNQKEGLISQIAQGGDNVSGGQKQRLSIARALVKNPPIYIFDDSFSALDFKTDAALRKALKEYTSDATVFIVAQRVSTIMNADQIIVLDAGRIIGKGTHAELLETCEEYREIAESQLSKEELA